MATGSVVLLLIMTAGLAFFSTDLTTNDSYTTDVESVQGQDLLAKSFPSGASVPTDIIVPTRRRRGRRDRGRQGGRRASRP